MKSQSETRLESQRGKGEERGEARLRDMRGTLHHTHQVAAPEHEEALQSPGGAGQRRSC